MSLNKLCKAMVSCNSNPVTINIDGGVSIPYFIEKLEFIEGQETIYFGEEECENYPFAISKDRIFNIKFLSDDKEQIHLRFDVVKDGLVAKLEICCDETEVEYD